MRLGFARRFVAGETLDEALAASRDLARAGRRVILNLLGENVATAEEARRAAASYIEALRALDRAGLSGDIAVKLTQLGLDFDEQLCLALASEIAATAASFGRGIEIDMEGSAYTARTLDLFAAIRRQHGNVGVAIQSYLRRSATDLDRLAALAASPAGAQVGAGSATKIPVKIRLVKGAYLEPASLAYQKKNEVDDNYRKLVERLLPERPSGEFFAALATHDPALVAYAEERIRRLGYTSASYEFQMIYGIRRDLQERVHAQGHPLRVYVPFGTAWCPYFMRRIAERPANLWFVVRSLAAERRS